MVQNSCLTKVLKLSCEKLNRWVRFISEKNDIPQFFIDIYQ
jgi:hypothetical protein